MSTIPDIGRFSLTRTVAEMIRVSGPSTMDDLAPRLDGFTRYQVKRALQNAKDAGWLICRRGKGKGRGSEPGVYEFSPRPKKPKAPVVVAASPTRVNSVWQLAGVA